MAVSLTQVAAQALDTNQATTVNTTSVSVAAGEVYLISVLGLMNGANGTPTSVVAPDSTAATLVDDQAAAADGNTRLSLWRVKTAGSASGAFVLTFSASPTGPEGVVYTVERVVDGVTAGTNAADLIGSTPAKAGGTTNPLSVTLSTLPSDNRAFAISGGSDSSARSFSWDADRSERSDAPVNIGGWNAYMSTAFSTSNNATPAATRSSAGYVGLIAVELVSAATAVELGGTAEECATEPGAGALVIDHALGGTGFDCATETAGERATALLLPFGVVLDGPIPVDTTHGIAADTGFDQQIVFGGVAQESATSVSAGALAQVHVVTGASVQSATQTAPGALVSDAAFSGAQVESVSTTGVGAFGLNHVVSGTPAESATSNSPGAFETAASHDFGGQSAVATSEVAPGAKPLRLPFGVVLDDCVPPIPETIDDLVIGAAASHDFGGETTETSTQVQSGAFAHNRVLTGQASQSTTEVQPGTFAQVNNLTGTQAQSSTSNSTGAITQHHPFSGTIEQSSTEFGEGEIESTTGFSGASTVSVTQTGTGEFAQTHALAGVAAQSITQTGVGALTQTHAFGGIATQAATQNGAGEVDFGSEFGGSSVESATTVGVGGFAYIYALGGAELQISTQTLSGSGAYAVGLGGWARVSLATVGEGEFILDTFGSVDWLYRDMKIRENDFLGQHVIADVWRKTAPKRRDPIPPNFPGKKQLEKAGYLTMYQVRNVTYPELLVAGLPAKLATKVIAAIQP